MTGRVLVLPSSRIESQCLVEVLASRGVDAGVDPSAAGVSIVVRLVWPDDEHAAPPTGTAGCPVVVVAMGGGWKMASKARAWDAIRVLDGASDAETLATDIATVVSGRIACGPPGAVDIPAGGLTGREHQIIELMAAGHSNEEIAGALGISYHTVRTHVGNVLAKLHAPHRHAVAALAQRGRIPGQTGVPADSLTTEIGLVG